VEQFVLKERIVEQIGRRKVKAALFYTFNFDPKFFENYVMPIFVPGKDFRDEAIHNKILWRSCIKQNLVPPVTVFCDYFAKSHAEAPTLGYDIFCIKVPAAKGMIANFHPKDVFILTEDTNGIESLILVTGSGNITSSGWCDNHECISIRELPTKRSPNSTTKNIYQQIINKVGKMAGSINYTQAEYLIYEHLNYVVESEPYFSSLMESFTDRIEKDVFSREVIREVEIVSPYFSNDIGLVKYLGSKGVKQVKCLVPALKTNDIQLEEETFIAYKEAGVQWSIWKDRYMSEALRNNHAKVYRFYGANTVFTVIGSVNFTRPAWKRYKKDRNEANIESAVIYRSTTDKERWLRSKNINLDSFRFFTKEDLEYLTSEYLDRNPPELIFTLDWKARKLTCKGKKVHPGCFFNSILGNARLSDGEHVFSLNEQDVKLLSKNTLIEIKEVRKSEELVHYYYAQQLFIENKPLGIKLDASTILKYWSYLEDEHAKEGLTRKLAESITDSSGVEHENLVDKKSLLNEMATHFNALVRLEKFLFKHIKNKGDRVEHFQQLRYYLLTENIDTISFYLLDLQSQVAKKAIHGSFYWMVLQILVKSFFERAENWEYKVDLEKAQWRSFKKEVLQKKAELAVLAQEVVKAVPGLEKKQQWVINQIAADHDSKI